ncbi:MAG: polysaccharide deacetylase family protein [Oscillospiraceae bacterium]
MKLNGIRRKHLGVLACGVAACLMFCAVSAPAAVTVSTTTRQLPIYCVQRDQKMVSISFDAAWGNEDTQQLIDILAQYEIKATFFVVGAWVDKYPESVKALSDAGHEVMNHSNTHPHMSKLSRDQIIAEVNACNDKIEAVTGVRPTLFRPPYGEYDDHVIAAVRSLGMEPIQWDVDSLDWKELSAGEITRRVTTKVQPGSIVLFHNAAKHTPEALPGILEDLIARGYTVLPISQLLLPGECDRNYTMDHTGRQCPLPAVSPGT